MGAEIGAGPKGSSIDCARGCIGAYTNFEQDIEHLNTQRKNITHDIEQAAAFEPEFRVGSADDGGASEHPVEGLVLIFLCFPSFVFSSPFSSSGSLWFCRLRVYSLLMETPFILFPIM